jgi:AraC family transcriptional regulator
VIPTSQLVAVQLVTAAQCALRGDADALEAQILQTSALLRAGSSHTQRFKKGVLATWRAKRVLSYIEVNLSERIRVAQLAREAGLSHGHLMRSFKMRFGITIRAYITYRRLATAQYRMVTTTEPLCEIALRCGMCDQSHFCRVFRRFVGLSPSRWRELQLDARS